jgi:preprotein translocase subunit SecF
MIRFSRYIWLYIIISSCVLIPGMLSLFRFGLQPSIDFTGGTLLEISKGTLTKQSITEETKKDAVSVVSVQQTQSNTFLIRTKPEEDTKIKQFVAGLTQVGGKDVKVLRNESVGPILGKELLSKALVAAAVAILGILLYVAYAFKNVTFGLAAVIALIHDLLVVIGSFALLGHFFGVEVDTLFVTAVLTTMSFSVHDTIVVFDRIREMTKKGERGTLEELADRALTQTISRSIANSSTIIIMLLALVLLGGESVRWFAVALLIGSISGAYSSPFVATPVMLLIKRLQKRRK